MRANKTIIVTGGDVCQSILREILECHKGAFVIGADRGLFALQEISFEPDLALGDFDSADFSIREKYEGTPNTIILNPEKDYTDTHVAVLEALKRNADEIIIVGGTGTRLDHVMGNLAMLKLCLLRGVRAWLIDANNKIYMINDRVSIKKTSQYGKYVSVIPYSDVAEGVTMSGFKYNVTNVAMNKQETLGISNEVREEEGLITVRKGFLLVMETKD